MSRFQKKIVSD